MFCKKDLVQYTSYVLLMHWVVLLDLPLPPTHDIFVHLEILQSLLLRMGFSRRQHV